MRKAKGQEWRGQDEKRGGRDPVPGGGVLCKELRVQLDDARAKIWVDVHVLRTRVQRVEGHDLDGAARRGIIHREETLQQALRAGLRAGHQGGAHTRGLWAVHGLLALEQRVLVARAQALAQVHLLLEAQGGELTLRAVPRQGVPRGQVLATVQPRRAPIQRHPRGEALLLQRQGVLLAVPLDGVRIDGAQRGAVPVAGGN